MGLNARVKRFARNRVAMCEIPRSGLPRGHFLCAYCAALITNYLDLPYIWEARCWDCFFEDYEPPKLPWWRVAA